MLKPVQIPSSPVKEKSPKIGALFDLFDMICL